MWMVVLWVPIVLQLILGTLSLFKRLGIQFSLFSTLTIVLHITLFFVSHYLLVNEISDTDGSIHCGMPLAAQFFLGIATLILLLIIIVVQLVIKRFRTNKT